ncbi:glycosyltransferase family 39 protein [Pedobacter sp. PLR]|uniref:ArnT family glycosyltransferase n=1 Tax=Pedobacter sp. PLR TaxID=2994465 RepID=UPI002245290D|nr:glycosyltransferase family 39 protein [Pedobacter sp. PLR]MCX2451993.1 glycosyltransferase family 39 protein [Pedobacter sp. PLR]
MLQTKKSPEQILFIFLGIWTILNIIQASFVEVHADEAYYWVYSRFLDWGYFDHPPMVALFIKLGDMLLPSTLGMRFLTVLTSSLSVFLLWKIVKPYGENIKLFILLFSAVVLFHVYGFITTPDSPLFFFTILFFYVYQKYVASDQLKWALLLALVIACLLYSKYHGILVLFFTILSNLKLLKRPSFWLIVGVAILAFLPHIWWQVENNYPSFYYHVIDRSAAFYKSRYTTEYLLAQLALAGPLVGWFMYRAAVVLKTPDAFIKAIKVNFYGVFIFFLFSTLKGRVEAHWTLPGMICLFILAYLYLSKRTVPKWFERLAMVNIVLILITRIILLVPVPALMKIGVVAYYFGNETWAKQIHEKAGDAPVIFTDSFQVPSKYNYYTRSTKGFGYDSRNYRKNQYDIWPLEDSLRNKRVYLALPYSRGLSEQDTIETAKGLYYGTWVDSVRMYQKVSVNPVEIPAVLEKSRPLTLKLKISNPYDQEIFLGNAGQKWACVLEYGYERAGDLGEFRIVKANLDKLRIPAKQSVILDAEIRTPEVPGKYKLIFSLRTAPFAGSRNSNMISVDVK